MGPKKQGQQQGGQQQGGGRQQGGGQQQGGQQQQPRQPQPQQQGGGQQQRGGRQQQQQGGQQQQRQPQPQQQVPQQQGGGQQQQKQPQPQPQVPQQQQGSWGKPPGLQQQGGQQQQPQRQQQAPPQQPRQQIQPTQPQVSSWGKPPGLQPQAPPPTQQSTQLPTIGSLNEPPQQQTTTTTTTSSGASSSSSQPAAAGPSTSITLSRRNMVKDDDIENIAVNPSIGKPKTIQSQRIDIFTNFFPVIFKGDRKLYQYRIDFDPEQVSRDKKTKLVRGWLGALQLITKFDGDCLLYSANKINTNSVVVDGVNILIKLAKELTHIDKPAVQFFNILTKSFMRAMGYSLMGRNYYTSVDKREITRHRLEVWKGFSTSIVPTESGTMLLCDSSTKVVRTETVLERMKFMNFRQGQCEQEIVNSVVLTRYNNKTYRISGIVWKGKNSKVTDIMEGSTTFLDYYRQHYPKNPIKDMNQPMLKSEVKMRGQKQTIYLVPELTYLTGLSDEMVKDRHIMMDLAEESNIEPYKRLEQLNNFVGSFDKNPKIKEELTNWGISYQQSLKVSGFVLDPPKNINNNNANALKNVKWVFICEQQEFEKGTTKQNLDAFIRESQLPPPTVHFPVMPKSFRDIKSNIYTDVMAPYVAKGYQFFLIIIPQNNSEVYKGIKVKSLVEFKVLTQCIFSRTFDKGRAVAVKLKQQVVAKLGFAPWQLDKNVFAGIPKKTMIVGIDVGHNSDMRGHSVVGFVATIDDKFQKYHSRAFAQSRPGKEIVESLEEATQEALAVYFKHNNCLPTAVVVYRDGVGDGMLDLVNKTEIAAMKQGFAKTPSSWGNKPSLMYVIVKKNTNARFFTADNKRLNPPPGTLIDSQITLPNWYDFYLVSQVAFKGSINPTHYHVLYDECKMAADQFQYFTFQMCHLYFNFEKSVRVPASCQYAHRVAFLIGRTVGKNISAPELTDKLFFL